jgi:hypothetical protein
VCPTPKDGDTEAHVAALPLLAPDASPDCKLDTFDDDKLLCRNKDVINIAQDLAGNATEIDLGNGCIYLTKKETLLFFILITPYP